MASGKKIRSLIIISLLFLSQLQFISVTAKDYYVTGTVTDISGNTVSDAKVSILAGTTEYSSKTGINGRYSIRLSGIYDKIGGFIEAGMPFPNPFSGSVNVPFIINMQGDIRFSVYNLSGQKVMEASYDRVFAGSYRIVWDGCNNNGVPVNYNFTSAADQAFGNNLILKGSKYCLYSGDIDQDGFITLVDVIPVYNDASGFVSGSYLLTDLTGDGTADLSDVSLSYNNSVNFISKVTP